MIKDPSYIISKTNIELIKSMLLAKKRHIDLWNETKTQT